jgi:hypothetical protein
MYIYIYIYYIMRYCARACGQGTKREPVFCFCSAVGGIYYHHITLGLYSQ